MDLVNAHLRARQIKNNAQHDPSISCLGPPTQQK